MLQARSSSLRAFVPSWVRSRGPPSSSPCVHPCHSNFYPFTQSASFFPADPFGAKIQLDFVIVVWFFDHLQAFVKSSMHGVLGNHRWQQDFSQDLLVVRHFLIACITLNVLKHCHKFKVRSFIIPLGAQTFCMEGPRLRSVRGKKRSAFSRRLTIYSP